MACGVRRRVLTGDQGELEVFVAEASGAGAATPVLVSVPLFPTLLPANMPERQQQMITQVLGARDLDEFWSQPGLAVAIAGVWDREPKMEDLSPSDSVTLPFKYILRCCR